MTSSSHPVPRDPRGLGFSRSALDFDAHGVSQMVKGIYTIGNMCLPPYATSEKQTRRITMISELCPRLPDTPHEHVFVAGDRDFCGPPLIQTFRGRSNPESKNQRSNSKKGRRS